METVANTYNSCILCKSSLVDRNSYLMPCIHSVCEACIKLTEGNVAEKNGSADGKNSPVVVNLADEITCKDCKEKFQVAEMVENLLTKKPLSETVVPPVEEVEVHKCTGCDDSIDATSHCEDCSEWLCDQCVFAHKRVKITKDHTITSKSNNNAKDGTSNETATYCKIHRREKYKFFCETCDMLTCRDCQLMEHKEHKYQFLSEAAAIFKNQTESLLNMLQAKRDTLHQSASKIQEKLSYVKSQKDVVRDDVQSQARKLVEHVIEFAKQILQNLNFVCDAAGKRLAQEGAEASSMLLKIDHMATFLKSLKNESNDLSLLYTKKLILKQANHLAQLNLDLYSLRGQLNLEYRHDTQFLFANLNKLGTVFVNGMRYPPPKNQQGQPQHPQQMHHNSQNGASQQLDDRRKAMALAVQRAALNQQQHQYNSRMSLGMQQHQNRVLPHQNGQNSHHRNQANLPFNWQTSRGSHGLQSMNSSQNSNVHLLSQSLMMQQSGRHQQQQQQQQFQSMKLNTRPVLNNVAANMSSNPQMLSWPGSRSAGSSPRLEAENAIKTNSADDDFLDCIITAAKIKGQKLEDSVGVFTGDETNTINLIDDNEADNAANNALSDLKKMQMELTEPEQASASNTSTVENNDKSPQPSPTPPPTQPQQSKQQQQPSTQQQHQSTQPHQPSTQQQPSEQQQRSTTPVSEPEISKQASEEPELPPQEEAKDDEAPLMRMSQEMPICSQPDPNEDYCACCHNGGDVLCCDKCPRVYHLQCHIPPLQCVPPGVFVCLLCEPTEIVEEQDADMVNGGTKRKAPSGLSDRELKICEKILLQLFCHQQSVAFHEPVGRNVLNYHKIVLKPQDFTTIKCKLSPQHFNHYNSVYDFLSDVKQVFINCALYNDPLSEVGKAGKVVNKFFEDLVEENLPSYLKFIKKETGTSSDKKHPGSSSPKRQRLDNNPTST